ncbi:MAG: Npt1/Npt2 family nucleotide transporter, partial [Polyangiaceae bacterium]
FVSNLVGFYFLGLTPWVHSDHSAAGATAFAIGFLLWVGVFNMMIVAQFWAFAADVYNEKQGKRLFALVGLGASLGAVAGSLVVDRVVHILGTGNMMLVSAGLLFCAALVTQVVDRRETKKNSQTEEKAEEKKAEEPKSSKGAYTLVFKHKYLILIAAFTVLFSVANTSGEFMLSQLAKNASKLHATTQEGQKLWIAGYFGSYFLWVNIAGLVIQTFLVSRIIKYFGFGVAFFVFPVVALMSTSAIIAVPILLTVRIGKTGENSIDYSLNNTVRNMLWLPTTRRMKYLAKQATDSFFARMGDVGSALGVFILFRKLALGVRGVAIMNAVLIVVWLYVAYLIVREHRAMVEKQAKGDLKDDQD